MSKMMKALEKAKEYKEPQYAVNDSTVAIAEPAVKSFSRETHQKTWVGYPVVVGAMVIIAAIFIVINVKTTMELTKYRTSFGILSDAMDKQEERLKELKGLISNLKSEYAEHTNELNQQIKDLNVSLKKRENEIEEVSINYTALHVVVNELTSSNRKLLDEFKTVNQSIEQNKKSYQKLMDEYQRMNKELEVLKKVQPIP